MQKSIKAKSVALFIISILFLTFEVYVLIDYYRHMNDGWADVGYFLISMFLFVPRGIVFIFAGWHFFDISNLKTKNKYYVFALISFIIFTILCIFSLVQGVALLS